MDEKQELETAWSVYTIALKIRERPELREVILNGITELFRDQFGAAAVRALVEVLADDNRVDLEKELAKMESALDTFRGSKSGFLT